MSQAGTSQRAVFWWVVIGVSLALWLLVTGLFAGGVFHALEADVYDGRFKLRGTRPVPSDVVIVTVDDRSLELLGLDSGVPTRAHFAELVMRLGLPPTDENGDAPDPDAHAKVIAFDYWLPERQIPGPDAEPIFKRLLKLYSKETVLQGTEALATDAGLFVQLELLFKEDLDGYRADPDMAALVAAFDRRAAAVSKRMHAIESRLGFPEGLSPAYRRQFFLRSVIRLEQDITLAYALLDANAYAVLARFISPEGDRLPDPMFTAAGGGHQGLINAIKDFDGSMRVLPTGGQAVVGDDGTIERVIPPLAATALRLWGEYPDTAVQWTGEAAHIGPHPLPADGALWVNFYGPSRHFPHIPLYRVLHDMLDPDRVALDDALVAKQERRPREGPITAADLKGAVVFVGDTTPSGQDFVATPFSGIRAERGTRVELERSELGGELEEMAGVEFHANAFATLREGVGITRSATGGIALWGFLVACLGVAFYSPALGFRRTALLLALGVAAIVGCSYWAFVAVHAAVDIIPLLTLLGLQFVGGVGVQIGVQAAKRKQVTQLFGRYLSPKVVKRMVEGEGGVEMEGHTAHLTTFFSDIRGFTKLAEQLSAKEIAEVLQDYFERMIGVVFAHEGTLDKLMGDAIMAFWGAPEDQPNHAARTCDAALDMIAELERLKAEDDRPVIKQINIGIGLNTGEVTVGNLGSQKFVDYTVLGDAVNLASRFEGQNKEYGSRVIAGEATVAETEGQFVFRELDWIAVKGRNAPVAIFELVGRTGEVTPERQQQLDTFGEGLALWRAGDFTGAKAKFEAVLAVNPDDGPSQTFSRRCAEYLATPPEGEWNGVYVARTK
ncbi:MAG: CHASE2 domain-containing protein [Planctomycetota bacterium]